MVDICHTLLCNHIHETYSGSAPPTYSKELMWIMFGCLCACVSVHVFCSIFTLSTQVKRNNYMFIFFQFEHRLNYFLNPIFHLSAMFPLISDHSPIFISHCQKGLTGYL